MAKRANDLTESEALKLRRLRRDQGLSYTVLCIRFNLSKTGVIRILKLSDEDLYQKYNPCKQL